MDVRKSDGRYEEAFAESLKYFNGDDLAANVFLSKYALKNDDGTYKEMTPDDMHHRMAKEFARIEKKFGGEKQLSEEEIYNLFKNFKYIVPGGSVMSSLGNNNVHASLSNCFVIGQPEDSYGSIMMYRDYQVELMKRRGGCIEENTPVITLQHGIIPIKDVQVGDFIKTFNIETGSDEWQKVKNKYYTDVKLDEQIEYVYQNGVRLKTSKKHPILTITNEGYSFHSYNEACVEGTYNKTPDIDNVLKNIDMRLYDKTKEKIGWLIGCHMGDGTGDFYKSYRVRILGDNKEVIESYKQALSECIGEINGKVEETRKKRYKSTVYEYTCSRSNLKTFFDEYIDSQINKKTYTWFIPNYIKVNNLWLPFIAGLIDSDGYITKTGRIDISVCSKQAIDELSHYLSWFGVKYSVREKRARRVNEHSQYVLHIYSFNKMYQELIPHIRHNVKRARMENCSTTMQSEKVILCDNEIKKINQNKRYLKENTQKENNLLSANLKDLNKYKKAGIASLTLFKKHNFIDTKQFNEICSRTRLVEVLEDNKEKYNYIDIEVEGNNNYYAGEFGFVNIHNCGVDLSKLRPSETKVNNAAVKSTGPVSFMEVNSEITKEVAQGGRRGALMISINGNHPDVEDFIVKKQDLTKCTGANISVQFTDEFMNAVVNKEDFILRWPVDCSINDIDINELPLAEKVWLTDNRCLKRVHAVDIWKQFVHCSWNTAEPGIMYLNKHWDLSPDGVYSQYKGVTTNPCGEIFMGKFDSCRLMHINLSSFVNNPYKYRETIEEHNDGNVITKIQHNIPTFDFKALEDVAYKNMRLCDDLVELELEHVEDIIKHIESTYIDDNRNELELWKKIYETGRSSRRAGCGATGLGDTMAMLGYKMNEEEGFKLEEKIFKTKMLGELKAQVDLAKERGTFVGYDFEKEWNSDGTGVSEFFTKLNDNFYNVDEWNTIKDGFKKYGRRNVSWSTMAPVGTGAIMCQGTSGVEPLFSPFYKRRKKVMTSKDRVDFIDANGEKFSEFFVVHKPFKEWIIKNGKYSNFGYALDKTFDEQVTEEKLNTWFKESPWYGSTAPELTPNEHIKSQSIVQKYTTHSISKTINLPNTATEEEISDLFIDGWKENLKGLTIYRDGCRDGVLITSNDNKKCKMY